VPSPEGQSGGLFAAGGATDPRGPWLRSELCCLGPSSFTTTPSVRLAGTGRFHGVTAYTPRLRCAGAPRRPARRSLLFRPCCPCVPLTLRRWVRHPPPVVLGYALPGFLALGPSRHPHARLCQPSPAGLITTLHHSLYAAARRLASPSWLAPTRGVDSLPLTSEDFCHPRFGPQASRSGDEGQARWANGKSPIVGTCTRPVTAGSEAAP